MPGITFHLKEDGSVSLEVSAEIVRAASDADLRALFAHECEHLIWLRDTRLTPVIVGDVVVKYEVDESPPAPGGPEDDAGEDAET